MTPIEHVMRDTKSGKETLGTRFTRLALASAALALLVAGLLTLIITFVAARQSLARETGSQAKVLAENLSAALLFQDQASALETLRSIQASESIVGARVTDNQGRTFAEFVQPDWQTPLLPAEPVPGFNGTWLTTVESVRGQERNLGQLTLQVTQLPLLQRTAFSAAVMVAAAILALLLAYLFAVGMRRAVNRMELQLDRLARHDPITGLFNRHAAGEHLEEFIREATRNGTGFSVVTIDLDNFKQINDSLGHHVGDRILGFVATRLTEVLLPKARAYRMGGDEFIVICPDQEGYAEPARYAMMASRVLSGQIAVEGIEITLSGSVGVARFPADAANTAEILRASDMAMYAAKKEGRNTTVIFERSIRDASEAVMRLEHDLRRALRNNELSLHYQPIVDSKTRALTVAEALLRWEHPERGLIGPNEFIDVAEQSGLIVELGGWVLQEAAAQLTRWANEGLSIAVAVNVSARQLRGNVLMRQYREALALSGCQAVQLEIELTEHSLVTESKENIRVLTELRDLGTHIAVDDFGTGLSSLAYLKHLPIDKIKIDRSFIRNLPADHSDAAIVSATATMAQALGLTVVAEGVETEAQRHAVQILGCSLAQGYLFSRPLTADRFAAWVREHHPERAREPDFAALRTGRFRRRII